VATAPAKSEIQGVLKLLADTPRQIAKLARGCSERQLCRQPQANAWSAQEIVAHLRACAAVWGGSINRMLTEDQPTIRYVSPRGWIRKTDYLDQAFGESLRAFTREREALLGTLRDLEPIDWSRGATFTATTPGRDGTVLGYAKRIAHHEVQHMGQIHRTIRA
jgi:uncharacterized damage-inducible protein DinB